MGSLDRRVSIIVPTYNRARFLRDCLDALLGQTVGPAEIIVVNDGSTDNTAEVISSYGDRITSLEKPNGGKSSALNAGLKRALGDYIWICDDDDLSLPDALDTHIEAFRADPSADFTYSGYHLGIPDSFTGEMRIAATYEAFRGPSTSLFVSLALGASGSHVGFMSQQGMLVRKRCYDTVGTFDESLSRSVDLDMNLRLCRSFRGVRINRPTFIVRKHGGMRGPSFDRHAEEERDSKWRETDRRVIRKVYQETPLQKYANDPWSAGQSEFSASEALLKRMRMSAKWELDDLVERDFDGMKSSVRRGDVVVDQTLLDEVFKIEALYFGKKRTTNMPNFAHFIKELLRLSEGGRRYRQYAAKHYYWKGLEFLRKGALRKPIRELLKAIQFI